MNGLFPVHNPDLFQGSAVLENAFREKEAHGEFLQFGRGAEQGHQLLTVQQEADGKLCSNFVHLTLDAAARDF